MLQAFLNMWRIKELRNKLLFVLAMLAIYRIGFFVPLLGVNQEALANAAKQAQDSATGTLMLYVSLFSGGSLGQSSLFGLGIMPYISAAIILQLLGTVHPGLIKLREDPTGRQKISEYTRYLTVVICLVQAFMYLLVLQNSESKLVYSNYLHTPMFWVCGITGMVAGSIFLMWLGEQIDKYGIGNGISLIITAGIVARMPVAVGRVIQGFSLTGNDGSTPYGPGTVIMLLAAFIVVVAGAIYITQGQRRIPIQQAKHTRGRRVYGGQRSYLPLRVNHGGVMPIIFASAIMMFPGIIFQQLNSVTGNQWAVFRFLNAQFGNMGGYLYTITYIGLIYFFAYFWTTVQFQPSEIAKNLRNNGSFIPGLRPGPRTATYLESVMERITFVGAGFLAVIAVIPTVVASSLKIDPMVTTFLGGTGLLIVVSVMLDFVQRIEATLMMRNYQGFLGGGGSGRGPRIRGSRPGT